MSKKDPYIHNMGDTSDYTLNQLSNFNLDDFLLEGKEEEYQGITIITHVENNGVSPEPGDMVFLKYNKYNGDTGEIQVEGYYEKKRVFQFMLGAGQVTDSWDRVFHKLSSGSKYSIILPIDISPENNSIIFQVEILRVSRISEGKNKLADSIREKYHNSEYPPKEIPKQPIKDRDKYLIEQLSKIRKHYTSTMRKKQ